MADQQPKAEAKKDEKAKERRPQALKRDLQNEKRRMRNRNVKSQIRTAVRRFEESLGKGDANASREQLNSVYSVIDTAVQKGVFKINTASRTKARLTARLAAK